MRAVASESGAGRSGRRGLAGFGHRCAREGRGGFTLVEVVVGSIILAIVGAATAASLSGLVRASSASASAAAAHQRADRAAAMIASDALGLARRTDLRYSKFRILDGGQQDDLLMLVRSRRPLREVEFASEGGEYEVQYRIQEGAEGQGTALWRRRGMAFDDVLDGGGIAAEVAPGVIVLNVEAGDGREWFDQWDSDLHGLPHLLRVTVVATSEDGRRTSTARRVVAFDRTPIPLPSEDDSLAGGGS